MDSLCIITRVKVVIAEGKKMIRGILVCDQLLGDEE